MRAGSFASTGRAGCRPALSAAAIARRALPILALAIPPAAIRGAEPLQARLDGGPFLPYRINRASLAADEGLLGDLELDGRRWDGTAIPLFRAQLGAQMGRTEIAFYLDEEVRGLEVRLAGVGEPRVLQLDLTRAEGREPPGETKLRARMRALDPPLRFAPSARPPARFALEGSDLGSAGVRVAAILFGVPISRTPLIFLGLSSLAAALAAALPRSGGRRSALAVILPLAAALAVTPLVALLAPPPPTLFRAAFPGHDPSAPVSGVLERRIEERTDHTLISYAASQAEAGALAQRGRVELVGLSALPEQGIPLEEVAAPGSILRLFPAPVVTNRDGQLRLGGRGFILGWVVRHEPD